MDAIIEYNDVDLCRKDLTVLKDVTFAIPEGAFVYLIGKVGSGKSTLLKSIYADTPINQGDARVFGFDLAHIKRKEIPYLRRRIGFVFQDFQLLSDRSVRANLEFVLRATGWTDSQERQHRIGEVLQAVGMTKKIDKMPHELSGGEQQRIAIARALLNKPKLILADEPTGNLDPDTGEQIMARLFEISQNGTTVIIATHNLSYLTTFPGWVLRCQGKKAQWEDLQ